MGYHDHDAVAMRWVKRALNGQQYAPAHKSANLHDEGDVIYSYGHHFEVARILRDQRRRPIGWLFNGNTFSVTTARHQAAVRNAIIRDGDGLPMVTIPHAALQAAGIELGTVQLVDRQDDWSTTRYEIKEHLVGEWVYEKRYEPGGWRNSLTGEFVAAKYRWDHSNKPKVECDHEISVPGPWKPGWNWERERAESAAREVHERIHHGVWEDVPTITRNTGRKRAMRSRNVEWDIIDEPTAPLGYVFQREINRHWLGASLIRAATLEPINRRCPACAGTRRGKPYSVYRGGGGLGPLRYEDHHRALSVYEHQVRRFKQGDLDEEPLWRSSVEVYETIDACRGCDGRGTVRGWRRRWAHYLSGFDENETRPSYFFCELPPEAKPQTVAEAYQALKPEAVVYAESIGREVQRQGDIFAIPMPSVTLQQLKKDGGEHVRRATEVVERTWWPQRGRGGSRTVRVRESLHQAHVLGTNHEATEVVRMPDGRVYGRGALTHSPSDREPDHKRVSLGKTWHLLVKNTVPIGA